MILLFFKESFRAEQFVTGHCNTTGHGRWIFPFDRAIFVILLLQPLALSNHQETSGGVRSEIKLASIGGCCTQKETSAIVV